MKTKHAIRYGLILEGPCAMVAAHLTEQVVLSSREVMSPQVRMGNLNPTR